MNQKLSESEIEFYLNKSIEKIPWEIKKIKIILFLVKSLKNKKIKKDYVFKTLFFIYFLFTIFYLFFK